MFLGRIVGLPGDRGDGIHDRLKKSARRRDAMDTQRDSFAMFGIRASLLLTRPRLVQCPG
jgi:hypothetical protein